jgi:putative ABC transport system permease protein
MFTTLESLFQDLRYGFRVLGRQPVFTATAVLTLALVIGATGAIFSLLDAILLRAWPFPHPEQLVLVVAKDYEGNRMPLSMEDLADYRASSAFSTIAAAMGQSVNLTGVDEPARLVGSFVSSEYFPLFGVKPLLGRVFQKRDDRPGAPRVCLLTESVWKGRFGADPGILGRAVTLNGELFTVVGIIPSTFESPITSEVSLPIQSYPNYTADRSHPVALGVGRLAPGVSLNQARAALGTIARQLERAYPDTDKNKGVEITGLREMLVAGVRPTLLLLGGAVGCVLLIACTNLAGLLIAKASSRCHEIAVRASLGASAGRIARQLLTESLLLAVMGGIAGCGLAYVGARLLPTIVGDLSGYAIVPNWTLLLFVSGLSVATGFVFGLAPALLARHTGDALRVRGPAAGHAPVRNVLVAGQIAVAMVLLAGAGLTVKSLFQLMQVKAGFSTKHILTLEYRLPKNKYPTGAQETSFHDRVVERVSALPGVEAAGIVRALPFSGNGETVVIGLPDRPEPPRGMPYMADYNAATPTYFNTVRIPLLAGREFELNDNATSTRVIIVNRTFAERFWPGRSAIGRQVMIPEQDIATHGSHLGPARIVGIVGDVKQNSLDEVTRPQLYVPYAQDPFIFATLVVRAHGEPMQMAKSVERAVWSIDKDQPMWKIRTLKSLVDRSTRGGHRGILVIALTTFSGFAMLLAAIGIYGVLAYTVGQRTSEFGIRMALGATPRDVLALVLRKGLVLTGTGLVIGVAMSLALSRFLKGQLYEVSTSDPAIYLIICMLLLIVSGAAITAPARRAMQIDPAASLRHD